MRKLLVALATLLFAGSVHAATLPYGGALVFQLATLPGIAAPGGGGALINLSTGGLPHLSNLGLAAGQLGPVTAWRAACVVASLSMPANHSRQVCGTLCGFSR